MLPPKPEALPTQSIYLATLVRGRGTIRNISKMNLDDKWTRTDLTDQIAKLNELTFFHGVACESKHGWCVRHLKHHSNLSPTNAKSRNQPPHQSNTTSFEEKSFVQRIFLPRQIGSSLQFQAKEKPAGGEGVAEIEEVGESGTIGARFEG